MHLKRLEIQGFKSFANKTTMEFNRGIIAIVGPNGSGKSNVADSLRWVLGEQSTKMIRGKKSDDVIFAGSEKKVKMGFAEVVATFDNSDHRIPVDSAEVSIGRRIDRSGESEYLINGNRVRLLDIVDLVLKSNIGTSRYTVIGQGTIDQMILAGPPEIKNLLDEASGVKTYYMRREKTLRRLEQTANNLMRAEDLIKEIEPRLKSLRRQAKRMEARAELEMELKIYQREFFGKTYWSLKAVIDGFVERIAAFEQQRATIESQLASHRIMLDQRESEGLEKSQQLKEVQEKLARLHSQKNKLLEELSMIRGKMQSQKTSTGDVQTLQVEVHNKAVKIQELGEKITSVTVEQQRMGDQLAARRAALVELNAKLEKMYHVVQNPSQVDWVAFDRELVNLESSFQHFYSTVEQVQDVQLIKQQAAHFKDNFQKFTSLAKESVTGPQVNMRQLQEELQTLMKQREALQGEAQQAELGFTKTKLSLDFLERELATLQQEKLHLDLELKKAQSGSFDSFIQDLIAQEERMKQEVERQNAEISSIEEGMRAFYAEEEARQKELHEAESRFRVQQDQLSRLKDQESSLQVEKAKVDTQMEVLTEEVNRILGQQEFAAMKEAPVEMKTDDLEGKISRLKNQLDMIGGMDELTIKEYQETDARYTNLNNQVHDLKQSMQDLRQVMDELDGHIKTKFNEAFHRINEKFEYYFRVLFNGGRAQLVMVKADEPKDSSVAEAAEEGLEEVKDPLSGLRPEEKIVQKYEKGVNNVLGIDIKATPPGKKLATIQALSGGERALTSIALLCSLLTCFPSPFVVLDEVDAALDDANTIRFGQILGTLAHQTQFITITHNRETMAQANILYGVTMGDDGISRLLSVKLEQAKAYAK